MQITFFFKRPLYTNTVPSNILYNYYIHCTIWLHDITVACIDGLVEMDWKVVCNHSRVLSQVAKVQ